MKKILEGAYKKLYVSTTLLYKPHPGIQAHPGKQKRLPLFTWSSWAAQAASQGELYHLQKQILGMTVIHERVEESAGISGIFYRGAHGVPLSPPTPNSPSGE